MSFRPLINAQSSEKTWRVACGVWRVACGVWRVVCGVQRVACGAQMCACVRVHACVDLFNANAEKTLKSLAHHRSALKCFACERWIATP
jgi:hypothetical protein